MAMLYVGTTAGNVTAISRDPSEMSYGLQDISSADAGRTQDGTMQKMYITQKVKLGLTWNLPTAAQVSEILNAFNHEYFYVRYHDALTNSWQTKQFYAGDMSAPLKWFDLPGKGTRYATLSFNIIER